MIKKKLLYLIIWCILSLLALCSCSNNQKDWKNIDAEKVILYNNGEMTVLENKAEIEKFVDLLQVDSWKVLNKKLTEGMNQILVAELYKNEEMIGEIDFFDDNIIQFQIGAATFELKTESDVAEKVLDTYIVK